MRQHTWDKLAKRKTPQMKHGHEVPFEHSHHPEHPAKETAPQGHYKHLGHNIGMFKQRFYVCTILTIPILYFSTQMQEWFNYQAISFSGSAGVTPILGAYIYFYGGWPFLKGFWQEITENHRPEMMTLISLAITVAFAYSAAVTFGFPGEPFYWELATLVDVMLLGHWIEMRSIMGASRALEQLAKLVPSTAHRLQEVGTFEDVSVEELKEGERILIRPGEQVPIDGTVYEGQSSLNESFLTGESRPVTKKEGDEVVAGSINGDGALKVQVTRTGEQTTISQMMRLVEEAQQSRSKFQVLADKVAFWLTLIAIAVGTVTFIIWRVLGQDIIFSVARTVTVLVIACPHALGLAIPLVVVSATALAAHNGILIRNREAFERAKNIRNVAFDKTGTLTEGKFIVRQIYTAGLSEEDVLRLGASLEGQSEHPLAKAIVEEASNRSIQSLSISEFKVVAGKGVEGTFEEKVFRIGRPEWADELGLNKLSPQLQEGLQEIEERGESTIALMDEKGVIALFSLADKVRESARVAVQQLKEFNVQVVMITGDAEAVAKTVSKELGIERYYARVLPQDKVNVVKKLKSQAPTAFVGDGINDAPALLEANIGIAIGAGTNVAIESADLILVKNDPRDVVKILRLTHKTYTKMLQNLFWATGYNVVAIPLAAGVAYAWGIVLSPALGALLMSASTVIVSINAVLLRRVKLV